MVNDGDLKKLLQLKKLETPGREYFDHFVPEFHRYQRTALLHDPTLWELAKEKASEVFGKLARPVPAMSLATATAAIALVMAVASQRSDLRDSSTFALNYDSVAKGVVAKNDFMKAAASYSDPLIQEPELHRSPSLADQNAYRNVGKALQPSVTQVALQYDSNITF